MSDNKTFDRVIKFLNKRLKSLVRERQRIWQILYQGDRLCDYQITLNRGNLKTVFRGRESVARALQAYLKSLNEEIALVTGWVVLPEVPFDPYLYEYLYEYLDNNDFH